MLIDIPFEFGQEVWYLRGKPIKGNIASVQIYPSGTIRFNLLPMNYDGNNAAYVSISDIFLSKEEAQQKLDEIRNGKQLSIA